MNTIFHPKIKYKIFDKTFTASTGVYGMHRFTDPDDQQIVRNNYLAICKDLGTNNLVSLKQVHGDTVINADLIPIFLQEPEADAAVTAKPGVVISILTADCVPVLLASDDGKVVGGAHCGWQSAKDNILDNLVELMQYKGATSISAIIGPAIQQYSYEVDQKFYDVVLQSEPAAEALFIAAEKLSHFWFDLPGFVRLKLNKLNINNIFNIGEDTYSNPDKYYSYRRDVAFGITGNKTNIVSTIMIDPNCMHNY
jgi:polyphenol oxidase